MRAAAVILRERQPMAYAKLEVNELKQGIAETKTAIQRGHDLLKVVSERPAAKGLQKVAESTPKLIGKLERDLEKLEKALDKKSDK
jgi:hypothetical protein